MPQKRPSPRQALKDNLEALAERDGLSGRQIAKKAKVDPKTVTNTLNGKHDSRLGHVDAVAGVFNLTYWDLLNPYFKPTEASSNDLRELILMYGRADKDGRGSIMSVARLAAKAPPDESADVDQKHEPPSRRRATKP
jgi:transcriptional regulator with XRE-family HTH domain